MKQNQLCFHFKRKAFLQLKSYRKKKDMRYSFVSFRIQSECGKIWTRKTRSMGNFYAVNQFQHFIFTNLEHIEINSIQDGHFRGCSRMGRGAKRPPLPKICHTYPTMMKLGIVIPYLKKTQKIYESRDTPPDFC